VELSEEPFALSALIGRAVRDQDGRGFGRVYEVRAHWEADGTVVLDELLVGRRALLRRLRGPGPAARGIPWQAVTEMSEDRIVVRSSGAPR
jgi:sporulation protein YlmC with PRC-barrel domain